MLYYNIYIYGYKMLQNIVDVTSSSISMCFALLQVAQVAQKIQGVAATISWFFREPNGGKVI